MCGICGYIAPAQPGALERMVASIAHRGPDQNGYEVVGSGRVHLGHTRLSILDLSERGRQPMKDASGRYTIVYNGELYNFKDLRAELAGYPFRSETDTEAILAAYARWGPACLSRFTGMFAFAIWDEQEGKLFAARDRIGIKPFYYAEDSGNFVFSSEIKAIAASGLVPISPDITALRSPGWYQVSPSTGFQGIRKLQPGCWLSWKNGRLDQGRYWNVTPTEEITDPNAAVEELDGLLRKCVADHMISDVPVGVLLSGGLDSSILVALMAHLGIGPIRTFTIRFADEDKRFEQMPDDAKYARIVAEKYGCVHQEITIEPKVTELLPKMMWHLDEPLSDPASINTYLIAKAAREHGVYVLLNGTGGDEVFGGYRKYLAALLADKYERLVPAPLRRLIFRGVNRIPVATGKRGIRSVRWAKRFLRMTELPPAYRRIGCLTESVEEYEGLYGLDGHPAPPFEKTPFVAPQLATQNSTRASLLTRMCWSDTNHYLPDHNLTYSDKCSMAAGVEGRPALTDHRLVEFMFRAAPALRIHGRTQKYLLKKVAERYLPHEIIYRPKAPFGSPLRSWMRGPLSGMVDTMLSTERLKKRGIYSSPYVRAKVDADRAGVEDNAFLLWTLLCNEVWFEKFFPDHPGTKAGA